MNSPFDPNVIRQQQLAWSRRTFLGRSAQALGALALGSLLNPRLLAGDPAAGQGDGRWTGILPFPHFPPRAKRVIHLYMAGGPSHMDVLDYKPELNRIHGQPFPASFTSGQQLAQLQNTKLLARGSTFRFSRCGLSGQMISDLLPYTQQIADDICIIRSMHTEQINHDPAHAFMNAGSSIKGRPSMGSWLLYGLGSETENLPGFVVLMSHGPSGGEQPVSDREWSAGFLPSRFQGVQFQSKGVPVHYVGNPDGVCQSTQRQVIDEIARLNGFHEEETLDPEIQTRVAQYELAFKMQTSVPDLADMSGEPESIRQMYGVKEPGDGS